MQSPQRQRDWKSTAAMWSFGLLLLAILVYVPLLLQRSFHDGALLWWGAQGEATLTDVKITSRDRRGRPTYSMTAHYDYVLPDGRHFSAQDKRSDLDNRPAWKVGDRIPIHYRPADPQVSTFDFRLSFEVYGGLILATFLLAVGGAMAAAALASKRRRACLRSGRG